jgi:Fur family ferric uptake transcriptional regulator
MAQAMDAPLAAPQPRLAKNHRLVHEILAEQGHGTHLAMSQVYALALQRRPGIGFTTVYRALIRLRDLGMVSEILLPGADSAYYEPAAPAHAHFRCTMCGRVRDVDYALPAGVSDELERRDHVEISDVRISFHGTCADCA